jgi:hypothetical protein
MGLLVLETYKFAHEIVGQYVASICAAHTHGYEMSATDTADFHHLVDSPPVRAAGGGAGRGRVGGLGWGGGGVLSPCQKARVRGVIKRCGLINNARKLV